MRIPIVDTHFSHVNCSSGPWRSIDEFEWDRVGNSRDIVFITDSSLHLVEKLNYKTKIAWLLESPVITPESYEWISKNYDKFDHIFTHSYNLLKISDKFKICPIGGCWLQNDDIKIHKKTKELSIILSNKKDTYGQKLRHECSKHLDDSDIFRPLPDGQYLYKGISLREYRFSVIIENCREDFYFSEKLIDCFATGTIPIYWGCPSIGNFFDTEGMLIFSDQNDFLEKIKLVNEDYYESRFQSVLTNFEKSKEYFLAENFLFKNYNNIFK